MATTNNDFLLGRGQHLPNIVEKISAIACLVLHGFWLVCWPNHPNIGDLPPGWITVHYRVHFQATFESVAAPSGYRARHFVGAGSGRWYQLVDPNRRGDNTRCVLVNNPGIHSTPDEFEICNSD